MACLLLRHLAPIGLIITAVLELIAATQPASDVTTTDMKKQKASLQPVGPLCLIFLCKFLIYFQVFNFFSPIALHSLVGLENGAMLLLGGINQQSNQRQTGIWMLKDDAWSRIGELLQV